MKPSCILLSSLVSGALVAGCSGPSADLRQTTSCCATNAEAVAAFTDKSLYQLDSTWITDAGKPMKLGLLHHRVQVVAMFFASCQYACPVIVHDMKRIDAALPESLRARVGFVLVTFDTVRDTPDALQSYRERHELLAARWELLRATPDDTLELAALLGVKYKREATGQFTHSNLITVLNSAGEIVHQQVGLNQNIQKTVKAIERAAVAASDGAAVHP